MLRDLPKYPKLIVKTQESAADLASSKERSKSVSNKNFFYLISLAVTIVFAIAIALIGSLDENSIDLLARLLDSVPYLDLKLSREIVSELKFPSLISSTLFAGNFFFLAFILFDIFRNQEELQRKEEDLFKESSSVSYAIHIGILLWIILAVLISYKPRPKVQVSRIEFVVQNSASKSKRLSKSKRKASKSAKDSGKHNPQKAITPQSKPKGKPSLPPRKQKAPPKPKPKPKSISKPSSKPKTKPPKLSKPKPSPKTLIPKPKVLRDAIKNIEKTQEQNKALPKLLDYVPNSDTTVERASPNPSPVSSEHSTAPASRKSNLVARLSSIPRAPDSLSGSGSAGGLGAEANAAPNHNPNSPVSIAASASINYGPYMSALQRKVKMAWKPPRGTESNRIIAKFTINLDGTLSDLILIQKSVFADANIAAIEAITKSAPFGYLPEGATEPIEIEFSFDYTTSQRIRY